MPPVIVAVVLLALLVAVALAFAWQEAQRRRDRYPVYGIGDAVDYAARRMEGVERVHLQRVLETEVLYLQGIDTDPATAPIAGSPAAVDYVHAHLYDQGFDYDKDFIRRVMELEAEYLASIGAVGDPVLSPPEVS